MPALASSGKMECCVSELVCRLDLKVVDGRNKSGHDSVGGEIWVIGLEALLGGVGFEGVGLKAWVWRCGSGGVDLGILYGQVES